MSCTLCMKEIAALKAASEVRPTRTFGTCVECGASGRQWELGEMVGGCDLAGCPDQKFGTTGFVLIPDDADLTDPRD